MAIRCYRNLLAYKRAGVGHNANGISDLQSGDLAVECPASPLPGKNLPEDWEIKFALKPHLRAQYLAIDANFRLKRKDRGLSGIESLTGNGGYFVDQDLFNQELKRSQENREAKETSTCDSSFAAIERANSRYNRGYSVTGVVAAIDSRHGFVLPNAVADLQKGERYFNSDFVFLSSLCKQGLNLAFVSYDIVCQWQRNLMDRCTRFESPLRSHLSSLELVYAIPKFHLPAHGFKCWSRFSLNFIPGSARVDGEAIERLWARTNPVATSTREMKAGARHDFLEERWGTQNFSKVVILGESLTSKLRTAAEGVAKHTKELEEFSSSQDPVNISRWKDNIEAYHTDPNKHPDPYCVHTKGKIFICAYISE